MSNTKHSWAILVATFTFPIAAIALVMALRNDTRRPEAPAKTGTWPVAPVTMQPPGPPPGPGLFHSPPPHPSPGPGHPGPQGGWRADLAQAIEHLAKELKLSAVQLKAVRKQADDANNRLEEIGLAIRRQERQMRRLLEDPKTTEAQLLAVVTKLTKLGGKRHQLSIMTPWRLRAVLTSDQRKRLADLAAAVKGRRWSRPRRRVRAWRGMGPRGPRGPRGMGPRGGPRGPHGMGPHGPFGPGMGPGRGQGGPWGMPR